MVVCEGLKTEPNYLDQIKRVSDHVVVELLIVDESATSPKQLVDRAVFEKKSALTSARKAKDPNLEIEHVWCMFDVDQHPQLAEAREMARANNVECAISNPNVELWFLLHFQDQTAYIERQDVVKALKAHVKDYAKGNFDLGCMHGRFADAKGRAQKLEAKHSLDGTTFPHNNPSSDAWRLVDAICNGY